MMWGRLIMAVIVNETKRKRQPHATRNNTTTTWLQLERIVYSSDGRHHKASKLRSTYHIVSTDATWPVEKAFRQARIYFAYP